MTGPEVLELCAIVKAEMALIPSSAKTNRQLVRILLNIETLLTPIREFGSILFAEACLHESFC
jgi:hypothetical protein